MTYFGISLERYEGYDKEMELKNAELPPDREPRKEEERNEMSEE